MSDVLRIANCSGFYGDRLSAAREMVAQADGVVREVRVEVGQMVDPDAVLVVMAAAET